MHSYMYYQQTPVPVTIVINYHYTYTCSKCGRNQQMCWMSYTLNSVNNTINPVGIVIQKSKI